MSEQESNKKKGVLTFDGKKYFIDELSDEAKEIIPVSYTHLTLPTIE